MNALIVVMALAFSPEILVGHGVRYFPSSYYTENVHATSQQAVLVYWPGPSGLAEMWASGTLTSGQQMAVLLGGAAYHDPSLLPTYREALLEKSPHVRQAAAYGYRDLIGDDPPNVSAGVSSADGKRLVAELDAVARTLREHTLVEMWLASARAQPENPPSNWNGIIIRRPASACFRAIDRVANPEDLGTIVNAYETTEDNYERIALMQLIQSLAMTEFLVRPTGEGKGWGSAVYDDAFERLDYWLSSHCDLEPEKIMTDTFASFGVRGLDPTDRAACDIWLQILSRGPSPVWAVAARQLYACGGPAIRPSMIRQDSPENREVRNRIISWYK